MYSQTLLKISPHVESTNAVFVRFLGGIIFHDEGYFLLLSFVDTAIIFSF